MEKARTRGACQAPRREAAKYVAKIIATGGIGHSRTNTALDDITSSTLGREGTNEARTRRPNKVSISPNPTCVKEFFVNFTKQKNTCTRYKATCKVERVDLSGKDSKIEETTRGLIMWKRDLLPPKALLVVSLLITEREECHVITKKKRRVCRTLNPRTRETVKHGRDRKLARELAHKEIVSARGVTPDTKGRTNPRHEPAAHNT